MLIRIGLWLGGRPALPLAQPSVQFFFKALDQCLTQWATAESCLLKLHPSDLVFASLRQDVEPLGCTPMWAPGIQIKPRGDDGGAHTSCRARPWIVHR